MHSSLNNSEDHYGYQFIHIYTHTVHAKLLCKYDFFFFNSATVEEFKESFHKYSHSLTMQYLQILNLVVYKMCFQIIYI